MRKSIITATVMAALLSSGAAFAGQSVGAVKSVDAAAMSVTLADGIVYSFNESNDQPNMLGGYQPGDMVTILWNMQGTVHEALAMSPNFTDAVVGKIAAINAGDKTVTLENGTVYSFVNGREDIDLGGFKVGDEVRINATTEGTNHVGNAIQSTYSSEMTGHVKAIDTMAKTVTL